VAIIQLEGWPSPSTENRIVFYQTAYVGTPGAEGLFDLRVAPLTEEVQCI